MSYGSTGFMIERKEVTFAGETFKSVTLSTEHPRLPHVTVTPVGDMNSDFNMFVDSVTKDSVTIQCSDEYTGTVILSAISTL
tara:strand:+ start:2410 stop:2655 length:246 start_codon:yes stop_codon:yes gene_type:complete